MTWEASDQIGRQRVIAAPGSRPALSAGAVAARLLRGSATGRSGCLRSDARGLASGRMTIDLEPGRY